MEINRPAVAEHVVSATDEINRLEQAIGHVAGKSACPGDQVFLPRDESSAWAWLQASHWLGSSVLQPAAGHAHDPRERAH